MYNVVYSYIQKKKIIYHLNTNDVDSLKLHISEIFVWNIARWDAEKSLEELSKLRFWNNIYVHTYVATIMWLMWPLWY